MASAQTNPQASPQAFWAESPDDLLKQAGSTPQGLSAAEAAARLKRYGPNLPHPPEKHSVVKLFIAQFASPISILLLVTAVLSGFVGEVTDAVIILIILIGSASVGFWQEHRASTEISALLAMIKLKAKVLRDGVVVQVPVEEVVPGDIVVLNAGDLVPADCRLLESNSLHAEEGALTGESFPVGKDAPAVAADAPMAKRSCALFQGTHIVSGTATALAVATGNATQYGQLAGAIEHVKPESDFEHGVKKFGYMLLEITGALVLVIFAVNIALHRPVLDVFLFSLALAVGLTPQLLPAIVSVTLANGARRMAAKQVLVRRLVAIEDFGGMTVLCTDKTGTLTEGIVSVHAAVDAAGKPSAEVLHLAYLNAALQTGFDNPIDEAIKGSGDGSSPGNKGDEPSPLPKKLGEVPYDFTRRRLSVLVQQDGKTTLVTKGAVDEVLGVCSGISAEARAQIEKLHADYSAQGLRCLGVASKPMDGTAVTAGDECDMVFAGLLTLAAPPKPDIQATLAKLRTLGIGLKMITGDNRLVAASIAREVGLGGVGPDSVPVKDGQAGTPVPPRVVTGADLAKVQGAALVRLAVNADVFAEVDPNQKESIILALKRGGLSVGYMGDGINDAPALKAADVGISVDTAVDVTREAADIVLLRKDLGVLADGVAEGRRAFANTLKYVFMAASGNFGNMFSMAGASMLVSFLPMLPKQILLLNLLTDLPAMAISTDSLDPEAVSRPTRWDVGYIRSFMLIFGLISSVFDYLTFGVLLWLHVEVAQFRSAWFVESALSEIFVLLVIRTARPFFRSAPSRPLLWANLTFAALAIALPYIPGSGLLGFTPLPAWLMALMFGITALLVLASEAAKLVFFRRMGRGSNVQPANVPAQSAA